MMFSGHAMPSTSAGGSPGSRLPRSRGAQHGIAERVFPMDTGGGRAYQRERDRQRPGQDRPRPGLQPAGPSTATEWSDTIEDIYNRLRSNNAALASHAHELARLKEQQQVAHDVQAAVGQRVEEVATSCDRRMTEGGEAPRQRVDRIEAELRRAVTW